MGKHPKAIYPYGVCVICMNVHMKCQCYTMGLGMHEAMTFFKCELYYLVELII